MGIEGAVGAVMVAPSQPATVGYVGHAREPMYATDPQTAALINPLLGVPWKLGSDDPAVSLDCAGFVRWVLKEALGVRVPACNDFAMWAKASCFDVVYARRDLLDAPDFPDNLRRDRVVRDHRNHGFGCRNPTISFSSSRRKPMRRCGGRPGRTGSFSAVCTWACLSIGHARCRRQKIEA